MIRLAIILAILLSASCPGVLVAEEGQQPRVGNPRAFEIDVLLDTFGYGAGDIDVDLVFQGCPQRDCIPAIDQPRFLSAADADYLEADDLVLSVTQGAITRAYPTRILDRHEIVNDRFGDVPVAITYCPLCGSGLAFIRMLDG
jgi:hypothetical protein